MINLVEMTSYEDEQRQAPCKHGNIVIGHACYCHHKSTDAPRKCPIWRNDDEWNVDNCELFEAHGIGERDGQTHNSSNEWNISGTRD